jgi:CRP/FNR family transcriptional regulator, cyclic AMP receptor protein
MNSSVDQNPLPSEYQANLEILMQIPMFADLPLEPLKLLAYFCKRESFKPGEIIFHQEEPDSNAYFIIDGKAGMLREDAEAELLGEFGESDFIGGMSLFCEMKRLFTLRAESRVVCLMLPRDRFRKTLEQFPGIVHKMFESLVQSIHQRESRFIDEHSLKCEHCRGILGVSLV